jgi:hypothetical protein
VFLIVTVQRAGESRRKGIIVTGTRPNTGGTYEEASGCNGCDARRSERGGLRRGRQDWAVKFVVVGALLLIVGYRDT